MSHINIEVQLQIPIVVFQEDSLWPHLTLLDNVSLPLRVTSRMARLDADTRAICLLTEWGLANRLNAFPAELSGGQRQRGALARAMVKQPKILCLDEITTGLDPEVSAGILQSLSRLKGTQTIVLLATHQLNFARAIADYAVFIDHGIVIEQGLARNVLTRPSQARVSRFLQSFDFSSA